MNGKDERNRGAEKKNGKEPHAAEKQMYQAIERAGGQDIWWPSSTIGAVGCTAFALSHRTGGPADTRWPSSPLGTVGCTAFVLSHRTGGPADS